MADTDYCSLAMLKDAIGIDDDEDDPVLAIAIDAASRQIDAHCGRRFYQDTDVVARSYFPHMPRCLYVDDISTLTGLLVKVDEADDGTFATTLTINTDFIVAPVNAAAETPVQPYTEIRLLDGALSSYTRLSSGRPYVQVTARFGWPDVPDPVERACVFQAKNLFKAPDLFWGSFQLAEEGSPLRVPSMDPLARGLLERFVRWTDIDHG